LLFYKRSGGLILQQKLHVLELVPYTALLLPLVWHFGIAGAAAAWAGRIMIDTACLFWLGGRVVPSIRDEARHGLLLTAAGALIAAGPVFTHG